MRVLLATATKGLEKKLSILNPELEYCAIVVDDVEPAKEILRRVGLPQDLLYPMSELKTCVESLKYDYVFCLQANFYSNKIMVELQKYNVPKEKVVNFGSLLSLSNFKTERVLRYWQEHSQEFEMFATGISPTWAGLDVSKFKWKLFNFAKPGQDLYYDYKIAQYALSCMKEHNKIRYALIGIAPYSFHYDLSQSFIFKCRLLPYFIAFNDLHNFSLPTSTYKDFFRAEWITKKMPFKAFNVSNPYDTYPKWQTRMEQKDIKSNAAIITWNGKYYSNTRDENIRILDDYLTLCEKNNIRPIMFRVPVTEKYMANFNKKLLDEFDILIEQALFKHPSARFFDGWKLNDITYSDFYDHAHLNIYGKAKFSTYLNDFIERTEK